MSKRTIISFFVLTFFLSVFFVNKFRNDKIDNSGNDLKNKTRVENKKRSIRKGYVDQEQPDVLLDAFAEIKKARDGSTYAANYRKAALNKALQKLDKSGTQKKFNWVERGPGNISGRSRAVLVDPSDQTNSTWWVASVGGGVWKTTNSGEDWELKTPELLTLSTMTMTICRSNPDVMYVGTGMGYGRTIDLAGSGVWKSIDHGETWNQLASTANGELLPAINRIIVDPNNENLVLLCSNGDYTSHGPNGGSRESGIFRSIDGGQNWSQVFFPETVFAGNDPETDNRVQQLIANPLNFKTIYASVNEVGVIKSTDAGLTWNVVADDFALPEDIHSGEGTYRGISVRTELAVTALDTNRIYAAVERPYGVADLLMSKDGGLSWVDVTDTGNDPNWFNSSGISGATGAYTAGWFDNTIVVSPFNKNRVFVGGIRLYRIEVNDVNNTRSTVPTPSSTVASSIPHTDHHWLEVIPNHPTSGTFSILNANDGGIAVSYDEGISWTNLSGMVSTQFYGVDKKPGENAYFGGMQDNSSAISELNPDRNSFWTLVIGGDGVESVWNHRDPNLIMGGLQYGNLSRSTDGGQSWRSLPDAIAGNSAPFISKIAQSKQDPYLLFTVGDAGVKRTDNFGETWTLTSIPGNWLGAKTFSNVEISLASPQVVWISSRLTYDPYWGANGGIHVSKDGGLSFTEVSANLPDILTESSGIGTHPTDPGTAYMLFSAVGTPKIMRTTDYGETWNDISGFTVPAKSNNGFPDVAVYSLLVMPYDTDILWAGTEIGLFISNDNGASWAIADNAFPYVSIFQMSIVDGQIIIATQGRGIWTVDIPELNGYNPPAATLSPRFMDIGLQPTGGVIINLRLPSEYDSTVIFVNNERWKKLGNNPAEFDSTVFYTGAESGEIGFSIESFKDGEVYLCPEQRVNIFSEQPFDNFAANFNTSELNGYFVGEGFSIKPESGFSSPAIHSDHPYSVNKEMTFVLYAPIKVASENAILYYEDVALIELGNGSNYYDYVIVEGTADGINWVPLLDKYDSRFDPSWLSAYNSGFDGVNSNTPGIESMLISHDVDLLNVFNAGDIIFIRFRLSSDPGWVAWGWAIDNIHIQDGVSSINNDLLPTTFVLKQNYPNPFNPETRIDYYLPRRNEVNLSIYNILGQKVRTLVRTGQDKGWQNITWNGKNDLGVSQASGTYIYHLKTGSFQKSKKMILLK